MCACIRFHAKNLDALLRCYDSSGQSPDIIMAEHQLDDVLVPRQAEQAETGAPPGFHMIPLPFADDLRARPEKIPKTMQICKSISSHM